MLPQLASRSVSSGAQEVALDELKEPVARHGDDVGGGGGCLGGEQVEQLALVVDEADVHLDPGLRLELLAKAVRDEVRVGPDVHLAALCMCPAKNGRGGQRGGAGGGGTEKTASGVPWCGHVVSPLHNRCDGSVARIVRRRSAGISVIVAAGRYGRRVEDRPCRGVAGRARSAARSPPRNPVHTSRRGFASRHRGAWPDTRRGPRALR